MHDFKEKSDTKELPSETVNRNRRQILTASGSTSNQNHSFASKSVQLNLNTIKNHFLGDYVEYIRQFGTTDNYSTQLVSSILSYLYLRSHLLIIKGRS